MNTQIFCLFTLVIVILELVQLPEAHNFIKPWKPYRLKPRWHPFPRRPKRPFKKWPRKYRRRPQWHHRHYTPKLRENEESFTIEIELPKNEKLHKYHQHARKCTIEEDEVFDGGVIGAEQKGARIKLGQGGKPKLRIKISRDDNLGELGSIDPENVTLFDLTEKVKITRTETESPWTTVDYHENTWGSFASPQV